MPADRPTDNSYQPVQMLGLIEMLRAAGEGRIPVATQMPDDTDEPIFIVRHDYLPTVLHRDLNMHERFHAGQLSDWYYKHFCVLLPDEQAGWVINDLKDARREVRWRLRGHPAIMLFEHTPLLEALRALGIRATHTSELPTTPDQVKALALQFQPIEKKRQDMSEAVLDGRLGEICSKHMVFGDSVRCPLSYAWTALVATASVLMPQSMELPVNIYATNVGPKDTGKSVSFDLSTHLLSVTEPLLHTDRAGSIEGLASKIGDLELQRRLYALDELAHLLKKGAIENSSYNNVLNSMFYKSRCSMTVARQKSLPFSCQLSICGGITEEDYVAIFGAGSTDGLLSRFIVGLYPSGFQLKYRPLKYIRPVEVPELREVHIPEEVWEARDSWFAEKQIPSRTAEIAIRVATICAAFDGRATLLAKDLGPALAFADYQTFVRKLITPNNGVTTEGKLTNAILQVVERHAKPTIRQRDLEQFTRARDSGMSLFVRALDSLVTLGMLDEIPSGRKNSRIFGRGPNFPTEL